MKKYSRVKAVINLDAIAHNFEAMRGNLARETKMIAVVKADGYGHGAAAIAHLIEGYSYIWGFAVATVEEALSLRAQKITKPILILGSIFEEDYEKIVENELRPAVFKISTAKALVREAQRQGKTIHIHLALDTGMTRIGYADVPDNIEEIKRLSELSNLEVEGLFTHFARADEKDKKPALRQLDRYLKFAALLEEAGVNIPLRHCANSAGIIQMPEAQLNTVRAGITIYGIYPSNEIQRDTIKLEPAMELKSHISYIKTVEPGVPVSYGGTYTTNRHTKIATIPVGYADGYCRGLSNKGWVLIRGQRAPVLGRICMDQFMVDVTEIPHVKENDEVTLFGRDGDEYLSVEELGEISGRFSYEFVCEISKRVPRVYKKDGIEVGELNWFS